MKLGVPTLCRYDLLRELIASAEAGSLKPSGYVIIDNGQALDATDLRVLLGDRLELIVPQSNLGVAASWNLMLDRSDPEGIIISNDDIALGKDTFRELAHGLSSHPFVEGDGWALFGQTPSCTKLVGFYDENFWPAYYEDVDYDLRMQRVGISPICPISVPVKHHGWATTTKLAEGNDSWLREGRERNHAYFLAKWGGESSNPRWNGNPSIAHYQSPFNGNPPPGWSERRRQANAVAMRWDVLNYIAKRIGADRYLEIGVAKGECMKHVDVPIKWGVDPPHGHEHHTDGVHASDVFVPRSSEFFFQNIAASLLPGFFDLVFIDGDHRADVVHYEVTQAAKLLSQRGVICLHDCNPHTEAMQEVPWRAGDWTGDVWKTVARLRNEAEFFVRVVPFDYGTAILIPARGRAIRQTALPCSWDRLLWKDLVTDRERLLGLLDPVRWTDWVDQMI